MVSGGAKGAEKWTRSGASEPAGSHEDEIPMNSDFREF
jgi:hypothetical protein